jgi:hypothetical protein
MGKINRTKLLDRQSNQRDAKLFIIATEGRVTEKQYFEMFHSTRIKIEVLTTGDDGKSAPEFVLKRLDEFNERYDLGEDDMLWLVFDVDRWGVKKLSVVCREAIQKGYFLAISNPCFEVWLYLHFDDLDAQDRTCRDFESRLKTSLGSYNKSNLDSSLYKSKVKEAINRGKLLHPNLQHQWPPSIGTHVHRLVEVILQSLN